MDNVAVLIPCFNEAATIAKVVTDFKRNLPGAVVYVYDNNSTDGSALLAENAGAVVRNEYCQGKGNVIRRMFREIDARCYVLVDGDDTYPAEAASDMIDYVLRKNVDMVVGDRLSSTYRQQNRRAFHNFGNSAVRLFVNKLFHSDIRDIMTGYRAFGFSFVKTFPVLSKGFEIETEMSIHAIDKNMSVANVVVEYRDRPEGSSSKLNTYSDGIKVLKMVARLLKNYRPQLFFGTLAALLAVISLAFFIPVFVTFLRTGEVPKIPTLIVCSVTFLAALLSFFAGMILSCIVAKNRQDFEMHLHQADREFKALTGNADFSTLLP